MDVNSIPMVRSLFSGFSWVEDYIMERKHVALLEAAHVLDFCIPFYLMHVLIHLRFSMEKWKLCVGMCLPKRRA
jgi:hypothetical protein